jgi:hypothetical protein
MPTDIEEVKDIISRSGNSFHCNVLKHLKAQGWTILVSPYYNDNVSGKPREIDLIAEKAFAIKSTFSSFWGNVNVRLFIECKYIPQKTVFWFHDKDDEKSMALVEQTSPCRRDNIYTKQHHYLSGGRVAKLFADEKTKGADNEVFFKALNQTLNGLIYYRNRGSIIQTRPNQGDYTKYVLCYPVIACNSFDNLYSVNIDTDDDPVRLRGSFQLEVNYAYIGQQGVSANEFFLIDIVDFEVFDEFLGAIKKDAELAGFFLSPS